MGGARTPQRIARVVDTAGACTHDADLPPVDDLVGRGWDPLGREQRAKPLIPDVVEGDFESVAQPMDVVQEYPANR
jgi:hypothetical protein